MLITGKIHTLTTKSLHYMLNSLYMQTPIDVDGSVCLDPEQQLIFKKCVFILISCLV